MTTFEFIFPFRILILSCVIQKHSLLMRTLPCVFVSTMTYQYSDPMAKHRYTFSFITAIIPDITTSVNESLTHDNAHSFDNVSNTFQVGLGQEFGLVCNTSSSFRVAWYHEEQEGKGNCIVG